MGCEEFKLLCDLTIELTKLKIAGCPGLDIANFSSELLEKLIEAAIRAQQ